MTELISETCRSNTVHNKSLKNVAFNMCKSGKTYAEYVKFIDTRIMKETDFVTNNENTDKVFRYKYLNADQIEYLKNFFKKIENERDNKITKHYEDILFRHKQKKNYTAKKNELIHEWRTKKTDMLNDIPNNEHNAIRRGGLYNEIYMYNNVVPCTYSKESLREVVFNH